jgi:hypothetical protein
VDFSKLTLFEGGVNHKIKIARGNTFVSPGESAIVAQKASVYEADHPAFGGTIFTASFSLSNSGETFELHSASSTLATYSYVAAQKPEASKATQSKASAKAPAPASTTTLTHTLAMPATPVATHNFSTMWLGIAGLLVLAAAILSVLYVKRPKETRSVADEFTIEG